MNILSQAIQRHKVDIVLLNKKNTKQITINIGKQKESKEDKWRGEIITLNSKEQNITLTNYLPRELISAFYRKCRSLIQ